MTYFLTVTTREGDRLHCNEPHESLESALGVVSAHYLRDAGLSYRWNGYFAVRSGELTRLYLTAATSGHLLRPDIQRIDILNERGLLESEDFTIEPKH